MQDDKLLTQYARDGSQSAFSQLVARHLALVYATCLRETGSPTQAEDAAQVVFLLLARKAKSLRAAPSLAGWLYQTARFVAKDVRKQEARRQRREQSIVQETTHHQETTTAPVWEQVEPMLNAALSALKPQEREAVLLRLLEGHTLAETGMALGLTEDAARMRVTRAVEKMRRYLTTHGAVITSIILTTLLTSEAARPIPTHAAAAITQGTLQAISNSPTSNVLLLSKGVSHTMTLVKVKYAALAASLLLAGVSVPPLVHALTAPVPSTLVATQGAETQTIVLQHIIPADILKSQHWNQSANLPVGVTQIKSLPAQNALVVTATPTGLTKVLEIVKRLDVEPRQVQITSALAYASDADIKASGIKFELAPLNQPVSRPIFIIFASGSPVVQFFQTLKKQGGITQAPDITTTNNVTASIRISSTLPQGKVVSQQLDVNPNVNSDSTITLALHPLFMEGRAKREVTTTRTIKSGDTMVIVLPLAAPDADNKNMLFFVTATVK